ncbi:MAG TPA: galactokinase [Microthrixaceae bacterium]|nr:galactokinase [Microthrixaceae bacterium]
MNLGRVRAHAPGRVNLIGEHTDYTGGLVMPIAIQLGTTIDARLTDEGVTLTTDLDTSTVSFDRIPGDPSTVEPSWGRYVAAVASVVGRDRDLRGIDGVITSDLPAGAGLSSSAALEVATALALGAVGPPSRIASWCREAEEVATGVPCGIMDQLVSAAGVAEHALLIDCTTLEIEPVAIDEGVEVLVVHSGQSRSLADSAYAERRFECLAAEQVIGPLARASPDDLDKLEVLEPLDHNDLVRRRARHIISENARVRAFAAAMRAGDRREAGALMTASHRSLRDDFEVSTPALDALVDELTATTGVLGARLTGAGFGGCVVALCEAGAVPEVGTRLGWVVRASGGARVESD